MSLPMKSVLKCVKFQAITRRVRNKGNPDQQFVFMSQSVRKIEMHKLGAGLLRFPQILPRSSAHLPVLLSVSAGKAQLNNDGSAQQPVSQEKEKVAFSEWKQ